MQQKRYLIPATPHRVEQEIQRSRFITTLGHTPTAEAARAFIAEIRAEFPDATHNCWAYVVGPPGTTGTVGMSDDGEPHGTAGRPMLTVLLHGEVGDITAVVTRYYGGTKLGTGGLVRAYTGCVQQALENLPTDERRELARLQIEIDYAAVTPFQRLLPEYEGEVVAETYGEVASYQVEVPVERLEELRTALLDRTGGLARIETLPDDLAERHGKSAG
jgi:uncharacterized YigZ family protein